MVINHFTTAFNEHEQFIIPFIFCINRMRPYDSVEIITSKKYIDEHQRELQILKDKFDCTFMIREQRIKDNIIPHSLRWSDKPLINSSYSYIGDIDILLLTANFDYHIAQMNKNNTFFSNIVRPKTKRLTGCFFTRTKEYCKMIDEYPNDKLIQNHGGDETMLYDMTKSYTKKNPEDITKDNVRTLHGVHMSLSREINGNPGWNHKQYIDEIHILMSDIDFHFCYRNIFESRFNTLLDKLILEVI